MFIYRERILAYAVLGGVVFGLGFFYDSVIAKIFSPMVSLWVGTSLIINLWLSLMNGFRDPMDRIFGIQIGTVMVAFLGFGAILIGTYPVLYSLSLANSGALLLCLALDCYLSKRESWRRHQADCRAHPDSGGSL